MKRELRDRFFNLLLRTLNYAIEFADEESYASLRFMDIFNELLDLQPLIEEISEIEFYKRLKEEVKRVSSTGGEIGPEFQRELLKMFIEEWKRSLKSSGSRRYRTSRASPRPR